MSDVVGQNKVIVYETRKKFFHRRYCSIGLLYAKHHVSLRPHHSVERCSRFCHFYVVFRTWLIVYRPKY